MKNYNCIILYKEGDIVHNIIQPIWKPIIGVSDIIDNMYQISTFGDVMNINSGVLLKPELINSGYYVYRLRCMTRKYGAFTAHRLVMLIFEPIQNPELYQVNHKSGNKDNNFYYNLEWCNQKENMKHAVKHHLVKLCEEVYNSKFTNDQVHIICKLLEKGISYSDILDYIGIENNDNNRDYIGNIKRRKTYKSISCNYNFSV